MKLLDRITNKEAVIGIVGLGYVGLPLAIRFSEVGFKVIGFDIDPEKARKIHSGESYIGGVSNDVLKRAVEQGMEATHDYARVAEIDVVIICVPTPITQTREPDLSYVVSSVESVIPHLTKDSAISLESTTYPGTTEEIINTRLEQAGFEIGKDVYVVYSPEREDPGNQNFSTSNTPKVCSGVTEACKEVAVALYSSVVDKVVPVSSTNVAEMVKLLENIHRAVNIGLVNEMKMVADKMGIDIWEVIDAAATKPFGFVPYYPGPGLGGHCIPIDPFYLTWKARQYGVNTRFIELSGEVNRHMPEWVVGKITEGLNRAEKSLAGSKILILGVAYKKNVGDTRESPGVEIIQLLTDKNATVNYSDPFVPVFPKMRDYVFELESVELTPKRLREYDCVVVTTNHDAFNYEEILENASLIVDSRGVYREQNEKVISA